LGKPAWGVSATLGLAPLLLSKIENRKRSLLNPAIGVQPEIRDLPLIGISAESDTRGATITIAAARSAADHITHTIHSPTHVRIGQTDEGADVALGTTSAEGTTAILRFRSVALPETVDGVVRP